jgi:hypothetical protein
LRKFAHWLIPVVLVFTALAPARAGAQTPAPADDGTVRVYFDCRNSCDFDFLRQEVDFVDYVRNRDVADVHVLVTTETTGSNGRAYDLQYIGLGRFEGHNHHASFVSSGSDTSDERRRGLSRVFSLGITSYLLSSTIANELQVARTGNRPPGPPPTAATAAGDKWNLWVFDIGSSLNLDGERADTSRQLRGNFSANRTTDMWKFNIRGFGQWEREKFELSDGRVIHSQSHNYNVSGQAVKSLGPQHWAVLGRLFTGESTNNNYSQETVARAGLEYSVFPYAQSTQRTLVFQYSAGLRHNRYFETTIYGKNQETRPEQSLQGVLALRQPWGQATVSLEHVTLLDDLSSASSSTRTWTSAYSAA